MTRSLSVKLMLAFLAVIVAGVALQALTVHVATTRAFGRFVAREERARLASSLAEHYRATGGWRGFRPGPGFVVVDPQGHLLAGDPRHGRRMQGDDQAVFIDGELVARVIGPAGTPPMGPAALAFFRALGRSLVLASVGAALVALLLGLALSRTLTRPLGELTRATEELAAGRLGHQVPVRSSDELGQLARAFNQMSHKLERAEGARRQMTADIAHELRTPLSVILGHTEALSEGVLPPNAATLRLVHEEAQHLSRLVGELRTLSLADAGALTLHRRPTALGPLLERARAAFQHRFAEKKVELAVRLEPGLPEVQLDPERMGQVLANLLDNALRHTPPGGRVSLSAEAGGQAVLLRVADSGAGIPPTDLERVFERFYRADPSRHRQGEESGLGLAIARSLVEAHGGRIWAANRPQGGAEILIELPGPAASA